MQSFVDAHCHPALKTYLYGHSPLHSGGGSPDNNYTNIQVTEAAMQKGNVAAVLAVHYLPERPIKDDWKVLAGSGPLRLVVDKFLHKIEGDDAFAQTLRMIDEFEVCFAGTQNSTVAHNWDELERGIREEKRVFVHALEGGHHLGRGQGTEVYRDRIRQLERRGVAMLTLAHFYPNDLISPTEGLPPMQKKLVGMQYRPEPVPLTETGRAVVETLLESGIVVDLTHTNPVARAEIFRLNRQRANKPLVFSHTGVRALFQDREHPHFSLIAPDDEELLEIKRCNGVVGVVFMNYFLNGREEKPLRDDDRGAGSIIATIRHIVRVTGSFDHVAIGTDFDGMSDPPDDLYGYHQFAAFDEQLSNAKNLLGATDADLEKIKSGNILRVLKEVWR